MRRQAPKRRRRLKKALEIGQRRLLEVQLYHRGLTQTEIAAKLKIAQSVVSTDLAAVQAEWLATRTATREADSARELARLDAIEREAWAAWDRSTKPRSGKPTEAGDPRFLERAQACVDKRCKILGLEAPKRIALSADEALDRLAKAIGAAPEEIGGAS